MRKKIISIVCVLLPLGFFIVGFVTLSHYGMNWDEPEHYIRGQTFLHYFLTGKKDFSGYPKLGIHYPKSRFFKSKDKIDYADDKYFRKSIYQYDREGKRFSFDSYAHAPGSHPPLNGILAALSNTIFYQKFGIMGDIESYHLFTIFISALATLGVMLFTLEEYGIFAAVISFLAISLYPLFLGESHFNIKDPVEAAFYTWTLYLFYKGITRNSWKWLLVSSFFAGCALGTKFNIFFAAIPAFLWLIIYQWDSLKKRKWPFSKKITITLAIYPFLAFGMLFLSYPNLWYNTIHSFIQVMTYYKDIGTGVNYQLPDNFALFGINTYPVRAVIFSTPLVTLLLVTFGIFYAFGKGRHEKKKTAFFVLLWFLIPVIRVSLPGASIYGGIRQIMEYIPPMAILAGIGGSKIVKLLDCYIIQLFHCFLSLWERIKVREQFNNLAMKQLAIRIFLQGVCLLLFLPILLKIISIHPNENVYLNPLIGGLRGARDKQFPEWGITLGSVYLQGMEWLNTHAEKNADLALVRGLDVNIPRIKIRSDINFSAQYYSGPEKQGEYLMEVTDSHWVLDTPIVRQRYIATLNPVYEVTVEGVPILTIWKNDREHANH